MGQSCCSSQQNQAGTLSEDPNQFDQYNYNELPNESVEVKYAVLGDTNGQQQFTDFNQTRTLCRTEVKVNCVVYGEGDNKLDTLLKSSQELAAYSTFLIFVPKDKTADTVSDYVKKLVEDKIRGSSSSAAAKKIPIIIILQHDNQDQQKSMREKLRAQAKGKSNQVYVNDCLMLRDTNFLMLFSIAFSCKFSCSSPIPSPDANGNKATTQPASNDTATAAAASAPANVTDQQQPNGTTEAPQRQLSPEEEIAKVMKIQGVDRETAIERINMSASRNTAEMQNKTLKPKEEVKKEEEEKKHEDAKQN